MNASTCDYCSRDIESAYLAAEYDGIRHTFCNRDCLTDWVASRMFVLYSELARELRETPRVSR
jgi:hypothetical protein